MKRVIDRETVEGIQIAYLDECGDTEIYIYDDSSDLFILKECSIRNEAFEYAWVSINGVSTTHADTFTSVQEAISDALKYGVTVLEFEDTNEFILWAKETIDKEDKEG
jgi:hypothetical protein